MATHNDENIKKAVRDRYAGHATTKTSCCSSDCCSPTGLSQQPSSVTLGYEADDILDIPRDADLGLGCGNPLGLESVRPGETVLDLGSGGGIDCFVAARRVGSDGRVIGVDMTPEMIELARRNASSGGYRNVEFRLGEIEHLPVEDETVDLVVSNCVINLVPDKRRAFAETYRVTKPGGRLSVSDIVTSEPLPQVARESVAAYVACLGGAATRADYLAAIREAGFVDVTVASDTQYALDAEEAEAMLAGAADAVPEGITHAEALRIAQLFHSVTVQARKPERD